MIATASTKISTAFIAVKGSDGPIIISVDDIPKNWTPICNDNYMIVIVLLPENKISTPRVTVLQADFHEKWTIWNLASPADHIVTEPGTKFSYQCNTFKLKVC